MGTLFGLACVLLLALSPSVSSAHMPDRPDLNGWFSRLASKKGLCCSFAEGVAIADVDWDVQEGHYRVRLGGQWQSVPDAALVEEPNRYGPAVVWPYSGPDGNGIRCFLPGAGT